MPSDSLLRAESNEIAPFVTLTITDESGNVVRTIRKSPSKGLQRTTWDMRYQSVRSARGGDKFDPLAGTWGDVLAMPGKYFVSLSLTAKGETKQIASPVPFICKTLNNNSLPASDRAAVVAFNRKVTDLTRVMSGTENYAEELLKRCNNIAQSLNSLPGAPADLLSKALGLSQQLDIILNTKFNRKSNVPSDEENPPSPVPLNNRLGKITWAAWGSTGSPTQTQLDAYDILMEEFPPVYEQVKKIGQTEIPALEDELQKLNAPVIPGMLPELKK